MARRKQQNGVGQRPAHKAIGLQHGLFLARMGTRRQHHGPVTQIQGRSQAVPLGPQRIVHESIKLQRTANHQRRGRQPQSQEPLAIDPRLAGYPVEFCQHAAGQRRNPAVAPCRARGKPCVSKYQLTAGGFGVVKQVWPQLRFNKNQQGWLKAPQEALYRPGQIERQIGVSHLRAKYLAHAR